MKYGTKLKHFTITCALVIALSFSFERTAHAYVDPGSGLLAFQSISAVVTGALFYFRSRIKSVFHKSNPSGVPSERKPQ
jgi:hypothetical protein